MEHLLDRSVQEFIRGFEGDPLDLALKGSPFDTVDVKELVQQVKGRSQIRKKLPLWYATSGIIYPPKLNLEQTSGQIAALYKASLCAGSAGADLTGGWGVDTYYLSKHFDHFDYFEKQEELGDLAKHNLGLLGAKNISFHFKDGLEGIKHKQYEWIYIDPSRRHEAKGKVIGLQDYTPDLTKELAYLLEHAPRILIKTAPMLDLTQGLRQLNHVKEIHVVGVNNEVKELLWLVEADWDQPITVRAVGLSSGKLTEVSGPFDTKEKPGLSAPLSYIYEPLPMVIKAGLHDLEAYKKGLLKLAQLSHYYTSDDLIDYTGRTYEIEAIWPYKSALLKKEIQGKPAWVASRNFGETVAELRKRWKLADAQGMQLIFTRLEQGQKVVLKVKRLR